MPINDFYGPLDWYNPRYQSPRERYGGIGPAPPKSRKTKVYDFLKSLELEELPITRIGKTILDFPFGERDVNPINEIPSASRETNARIGPATTKQRIESNIEDVIDSLGKNIPFLSATVLAGKGAQSARTTARNISKLRKAEAEASRIAKANAIADNAVKVAEQFLPGAPLPLSPIAGTLAKPAQLRAKETWPFLPDRLLPTEGPVKKKLLEPAAKLVGKPSIPYIRQEMRKAGFLPDLQAPKKLEAPKTRFYAGPEGVEDYLSDIKPLDIPLPAINRRKPVTLPPLVQPKITLPSLGRTPFYRGSKTEDSVLGGVEDLWRSRENRLRADSPAGSAIADKIQAYQTDKAGYAGGWEVEFDDITRGIKGKDWDILQQSFETGVPINNPRLENARQAFLKLDTKLSSSAVTNEIKFRKADGTLTNFTPREDYWPHIYEEKFWKDPKNVANALVEKHNIPLDLALKIVARAKENGGRLILEPELVNKAMAKRMGIKLKDFQHSRVLDLPGYRIDKGAYKIHIRDMADRIAAKQQFGDMDIAGKVGKDEFATLMDGMNKKNEMTRLLVQYFDREGIVPNKGMNKASNALMLASTIKNLPMFALTNLQQLAAIASTNTMGGMYEAAKTAIPFTKAATRRLRTGLQSGASTLVHSPELQGNYSIEGKVGDTVSSVYGISRGERYNRSLAAVAGERTATDLHVRLLKDPTNDALRNRLERLTLTPANQLLAQKSLTARQLDRAGYTMSIQTQGHMGKFELPAAATGGKYEGLKNLGGQFRKYPYGQAKLFIDSLVQNPVQTLTAGTAAYLAAGEGVGVVKDAKRALVDSIINKRDFSRAWDEQRKNRGSIGLPRVGKALTEGWQYGIPTDLAWDIIAGRPLASLTPPIAEMITSAALAANRAVTNKTKKKRRDAGIDYVSQWAIPFGRDIVAARKKKTGNGLPPLPSLSGLPELPEGW